MHSPNCTVILVSEVTLYEPQVCHPYTNPYANQDTNPYTSQSLYELRANSYTNYTSQSPYELYQSLHEPQVCQDAEDERQLSSCADPDVVNPFFFVY